MRALVGHFLRQRPVIEAAELIRDHVGHGARRFHEVQDLGMPVGPERHDRYRTYPLQCEIRIREGRNVVQLHDDAIQRPHADLMQSHRQAQ